MARRQRVKGQRAAARGRRGLLPALLLTALVAAGLVYSFLPRVEPRLGPAPPGATLEAASNFSLPSVGGGTVSLSDYRGRNILLFFHEGLGCPPCWKQDAEIERDMDKFRAMGISDVVTIVVDPMPQTTAEYRQWKLTFPMLVDSTLAVSRAYDALNFSMHPGFRPGHTFFLIDAEGLIRWRKDYYIGGAMDPHGHVSNPNDRMYVPMGELLRDVRWAIEGKAA